MFNSLRAQLQVFESQLNRGGEVRTSPSTRFAIPPFDHLRGYLLKPGSPGMMRVLPSKSTVYLPCVSKRLAHMGIEAR